MTTARSNESTGSRAIMSARVMRKRKRRQEIDGKVSTRQGGEGTTWAPFLEVASLLFAAGSVAIATVKILVLADFNIATVPVILRGLDFVAVAFSVLMTSVTLLPFVLGSLFVFYLKHYSSVSRKHQIVVALLVFLAIALVFPLLLGVAQLLMSAALLIPRKIDLGNHRQRDKGAVRTGLILRFEARLKDLDERVARWPKWWLSVSVLSMIFFMVTFNGSPGWMALEKVSVKEKVYIGWVLESGDHDLTLLNYESRVPIILRQDDIEKRTLCRRGVKDFGAAEEVRLVLKKTLLSLLREGLRSPEALPPCHSV